ncbi:Mitochondrial inheritance and actin cytoskeleton organization protein [Scheffersomyces stipitis CBS 6054]|uniref:Mitochondrial inheritance and actin cytoskeleton organization protein n=1 Tax=Scheffersomyces stipitis (strain ATCC 58785 / CBS 6054 / NBRC 10063 / NRRL Y-11545) TaxID=322104 RepID=A3GFD2_PICST|nr:Mitochondrial inheritance and actin cytoskeleton organization protein [Scheffersomyces stipitis CBS 6054]EAZ63735.2 Mitochondrial inheritance and actin cytoskeleton organization protein [Scheffersomyces stipitis CBS 6054]
MSDSDAEILDLIDQGSYAYAQTLLAKKIKKFPQRSYYYALNNQLLHKLGKTKQALEANLKLMEKIPNEPQTVALLSDYFSELGYEKEANLVYENVIKRYPTNTSLIKEWFERSIDKFNLRLFNKIFVNLSKSDKSSRLYKFWNSFSYFLLLSNKERADLSDKESDLFKTLGLRLIEDLKPFENTQELFVYFNFLKLNKDYETIISSIEKDVTFNLDLDLKIMYLEVLQKSENFQKLYDYSKKLIFEEDFNDFNTWLLLLKASKKLNYSFSETFTLIQSQPSTRNSLLAAVELAILYEQASFASIESYYIKFNRKLTCFYDLKNYFDTIDRKKFAELVQISTDEILANNPSTTNDLVSLINNQKFYFMLNKDSIDIESYISTNWKIFNLFKDNTNIRGGEFDNNPANELAIISIIIDLSTDSSIKNIIKNITIISQLLKNDQYNHKLKLWLMKLYSQLNTTNLIMYNYQKLSIKMIQHDTLSHYLYTVNPSKQHLTNIVNIFRFYLTSSDEVKSSVFQGFEKGVFNKLFSFINFGRRLNNSISKQAIVLMVLKFSMVLGDQGYITYFVNHLKNNSAKILSTDEFEDNRDFKSEWKFGLADEGKFFNTDLLSLPLSKNQVNDNSVRLEALKYLIIYEDKEEIINKYLKQYNKIISNYKATLPFDTLVDKLNVNVLRFFKQKLNTKEQQSILNFLLKNLKIDKLRSTLIPSSFLSWELNHNLINLVEFIRITNYLVKRYSLSNPLGQELKTCLDQLARDLKKINIVDSELKQLEEIKSTMDVRDFPIDISTSEIDDSFGLLHESISESTGSFYRNL